MNSCRYLFKNVNRKWKWMVANPFELQFFWGNLKWDFAVRLILVNPDAALPKRETLLNRGKKESCCNPFSYSASALESRFLKLILVGSFACASCMGDVFYYVFDAFAIIHMMWRIQDTFGLIQISLIHPSPITAVSVSSVLNFHRF